MGFPKTKEKKERNSTEPINLIYTDTFTCSSFFTALRLLNGLSKHNIQGGGSWPPVLNIAAKSSITVNATCGQNGPEEYCDMIDADTHRYVMVNHNH